MRVIFLDIDGVLNNIKTKENFRGYIGIDEKNLQALKSFIDESNKEDETKIVLSSSWRLGLDKNGDSIPFHYKYLIQRLASVGLSIYDETPETDKGTFYRGFEIKSWVATHKDLNITGILVLDDICFSDFKTHGITKQFVQTSDYKGGFTEKHFKNAFKTIRKPAKNNTLLFN